MMRISSHPELVDITASSMTVVQADLTITIEISGLPVAMIALAVVEMIALAAVAMIALVAVAVIALVTVAMIALATVAMIALVAVAMIALATVAMIASKAAVASMIAHDVVMDPHVFRIDIQTKTVVDLGMITDPEQVAVVALDLLASPSEVLGLILRVIDFALEWVVLTIVSQVNEGHTTWKVAKRDRITERTTVFC